MSLEQRRFAATVHREDGSYWAEVPELPGCFASGETIGELRDAIEEAVALYLADGDSPAPLVDVESFAGRPVSIGVARSQDGLSAREITSEPVAHPPH